jgi:hypothetical protein
MPRAELTVRAIVRFARPAPAAPAPCSEAATFRVEQLLQLADGATLYTIKSEAEPFCRIVAEGDLDRHLNG